MQDAVDLGYSYSTCDSEDSFTQYYNLRDGVVQLCSVFAQDAAPSGGAGGRPCGATHTHRQVEAMTASINALNGGRGFEVSTYGLSLTRYLTFNYTFLTYPAGAWETTGRAESAALFGGGACDVVVGMAHGCPDADVAAQALVANASGRLYFTGRGPQALLEANGEQPHLFSTHIRSDSYAVPALRRYQDLGMSSVALLFEASDDLFYTGLGEFTLKHVLEQMPRVTLSYSAALRPSASSGGQIDQGQLAQSLTAAHATRADVLVLVLPVAAAERAMRLLRSWRPPAGDANGGHVYRGIWWQGVPWREGGGEEGGDGALSGEGGHCAGLAEWCDFVVGASQMAQEETMGMARRLHTVATPHPLPALSGQQRPRVLAWGSLCCPCRHEAARGARPHAPAAWSARTVHVCATGRYTDALLGSTFAELRRDYMAELPEEALRLPDAASIPSAIAQARELPPPSPTPNPSPSLPLPLHPSPQPGAARDLSLSRRRAAAAAARRPSRLRAASELPALGRDHRPQLLRAALLQLARPEHGP